MTPSPNERKLVEIAMELVLTYHGNRKAFKKKSQDDVAAWVSEQLNACGFEGSPCGMNYHLLTKVPG